jgi:hypothetical protein
MNIIIQNPNNNKTFFKNYPSQKRTLQAPPVFNEAAENYIRFVQGANAFIAVKLFHLS